MSLSAAVAAVPYEPAETRKLLLVIFAVTVATYLLTGPGVPQDLSTDDAMRLVQVRDLLAGQGWYDLTQYRLSPPEGVATHWSRLVDLPLALLIGAGKLAMAPALAERLALTVWPALLLLAFLFGVVQLARELADDTAARLALLFAAITAPVLQHFRPGAIDHHNVQLVLMVWSVALVVRERPRDAALSGMLCALSLAIGQEMAPATVAVAAVVAIRWIMNGAPSGPAAASFGTALATGTLAAFAATVPPAHYLIVTCDALSIAHTLPVACGGFGLAILTRWRRLDTVRKRVAGAAALGEVVSVIVVLGFPACFSDPYHMSDPRMWGLWIGNLSESRSLASMLRDLPHEVPAYYGLPAIALALGLYRSHRDGGPSRWGWIIGTSVVAIALVFAAWQMRFTALANAIALAMVAAALVRGLPAPDGRAVFLGLGRAVVVVALLVNPLALIAAGKAGAWTVQKITGTRPPLVISDGPGTCRLPSDYAPLARLPQGLVLGFIDAGPFLLMETPHTVLAAPYHRNLRGNTAMFEVFLGRPDEAGARLAALGVDYVAFCPGAPERHNYAAAAPEGLAAALGRNEIPASLERIALDGTDLVVYRRRR